MNRRIGIITQARTTSSRLPKKVLLSLAGKTVLEHHLDRLAWAQIPVLVATTTNATDDAIVEICRSHGIPCSRGSEHDVLARFYECAQAHVLDVVVRVTSDCPLIDGYLIADALKRVEGLSGKYYLSNCIHRTFPRGFDFEIFDFHSLKEAHKNAHDSFEREHVTPYVRNATKNLGVNILDIVRSQDASNFRITLDEEADFKLMKILFEEYALQEKRVEDIIQVLEEHPEVASINSHVEQKKI